MTHETSADPKQMWQGQRREHPAMRLEEIRLKVQAVQAKVRRNLMISFGVSLLLLVLCFVAIRGITYTPVRLITGAMMLLTVVIGYIAYSKFWPATVSAPDNAAKGCLEFYRRELEAEYQLIALTWRLLVPVAAFGFMTWSAFFRTSPLVPRILFSALLVVIFVLRRYEVRKFKNKVAALDDFKKEIAQ